MAKEQAALIAADLVKQGGYKDLENRKVLALVAYLQRLGTDIHKAAPTPATPTAMATAGKEQP
jgi:hypothetical protein